VSSVDFEGSDLDLAFNWDLFSHATTLLGRPVILLGRFKGQGLGLENVDFRVLMRVEPDKEYIKLILYNNRLVGAALIGNTDLAETFYNLILNQFNLTDLIDHLLDPDIDLDAYFD